MTSKKSTPDKVAPAISWEEDYRIKHQDYEALWREAVFTLETEYTKRSIKIHAVEGRVKNIESIRQKALDKQLEHPLEELIDIVGVRTICLFRSDLTAVDDAIRSCFVVDSVDDKINESVDIFGYMSTHYVCRIKAEHVGPRYDRLKCLKFEIQTRTLCMHAWAAVSHYLSYKGDWDVPTDHKKAINALSGLFYIADNEFEASYQVREKSLISAKEEIEHGKLGEAEINLDTISAYLKNKFPSRRQSNSNYSSFVKELIRAEYNTIGEVDIDIDRGAKAFSLYETKHPPEFAGNFSDVGVARISLGIVSPAFFEACEGKLASRLVDFREHVRN